jgi:hypothetical protein
MSVAGILVFSVVLLAALGGINLHVFRWARNAFGLGRRAQLILKGVLWASVAGMILGRVAGRFWPGAPSTSLIAVASTIELAVIISFAFLLVADLGLFLASVPERARRLRTRDVVPAAPEASAAPVVELAPAPVVTWRKSRRERGSAMATGYMRDDQPARPFRWAGPGADRWRARPFAAQG